MGRPGPASNRGPEQSWTELADLLRLLFRDVRPVNLFIDQDSWDSTNKAECVGRILNDVKPEVGFP